MSTDRIFAMRFETWAEAHEVALEYASEGVPVVVRKMAVLGTRNYDRPWVVRDKRGKGEVAQRGYFAARKAGLSKIAARAYAYRDRPWLLG